MTRRQYLEKSLGDSLRTLKMATKLDKLMETLPKPEGIIPNFGLPRWQIISLDTKLPSIPAPKDTYHFSRKKIGRQLFISSKDAQFHVEDPYNYEIFLPYDSLHDKHLANYFSKKNILNYLIQRGFVTKNLDAICTAKEYNMYRKYLKKVYNDTIKKEFERQRDSFIDSKILQNAELQAQKDIKKIKTQKQQKLLEKQRKNVMLSEKKKLEQKRMKVKKDQEQLEKVERNKRERLQQIMLKSNLHAEKVKRNQSMMNRKYQNKLINNLLKRARQEKIREKKMQEKKIQEAERKRRNSEEKWQQKQQFQRQQIAMEKFLLEYALERRKILIREYNEKIKENKNRKKENVGELKIKVRKVSKRKKKRSQMENNSLKRLNNARVEKKKKPTLNKLKDVHIKEERSSKDLCLMTDKCKCDDPENEFCEDHQ